MTDKYYPNDAKVMRSAMKVPVADKGKIAKDICIVTDKSFRNIYLQITIADSNYLAPIDRKVLKALKGHYDIMASIISRYRGGDTNGGHKPAQPTGQPDADKYIPIKLPAIIEQEN